MKVPMAVATASVGLPVVIDGPDQSVLTDLLGRGPEIVSKYARHFTNNIASGNAVQVGSVETTFTGAIGAVNFYPAASSADNNDGNGNRIYLVNQSASSTFTGRDELLSRMAKTMFFEEGANQRRFVLYGLGGSGKTQVALKYLEMHRERYWGVFWIDCSDEQNIIQGYANIATACNARASDLASTKRWLAQSSLSKCWLLVLDNADDPRLDLQQYYPPGARGHVLITTRNPDVRIHATCGSHEFIGLDNEDDAVSLLRKLVEPPHEVRDSFSEEYARQVVMALGLLPLAIAQAGSAIRYGLCRMEEFLDVFEKRRKMLLSRAPLQNHSDYRYAVYTTWEISVAMIVELQTATSKYALDLLSLFAHFHHNNISEDIFRWARERHAASEISLKEDPGAWLLGQDVDWDDLVYKEAIALLAGYSLIVLNSTSRTVSIHPLVHSWARDRLSAVEQKSWAATAAMLLAIAIPRDESYQSHVQRAALIPHVLDCLAFFKLEQRISQSAPQERYLAAVKSFSRMYSQAGQLEPRLQLLSAANTSYKELYGADDPQTLLIMDDLCDCHIRMGDYGQARELCEFVLEARQRALPTASTEIWDSWMMLVRITLRLGEYEKSLRLSQVCLEEQETMSPIDSYRLTMALEFVAISHSELKDYGSAMPIQERVVQLQEDGKGPNHPGTLQSKTRLAYYLATSGKIIEGLHLAQVTYEIRKEVQGREYTDTLTTLGVISYIYFLRGDFVQSYDTQLECYESRARILGQEHPETLMCLHNSAIARYATGKRQEALSTMREAAVSKRRVLGALHPETQSSLACIDAWDQQSFESASPTLPLTYYGGQLAQSQAYQCRPQPADEHQPHPGCFGCLSSLFRYHKRCQNKDNDSNRWQYNNFRAMQPGAAPSPDWSINTCARPTPPFRAMIHEAADINWDVHSTAADDSRSIGAGYEYTRSDINYFRPMPVQMPPPRPYNRTTSS